MEVDLLIGIPSARIVNAIAFLSSDMSEVTEGIRGWS
jgi:hypothetical protein